MADKLILSAHQSTNDSVFADLMRLHVPKGSRVADVTYGRGVFWKLIPAGDYHLTATDLSSGVDCRKLPYAAGSYDAVVFDPPYIEGFFRRAAGSAALASHSDFFSRYSHADVQGSKDSGGSSFSYHEQVIGLYRSGIDEAYRVLRDGGVLVLKCQDEVSCHRQFLTHVQIINYATSNGLYCKDLFVVMRRDTPQATPRMKRQKHARKNHSYFLVFVKQSAIIRYTQTGGHDGTRSEGEVLGEGDETE